MSKRILYKPEDWQRVAEFVIERVGGGRNIDNFTAIGLADDDKIIAGVLYGNYNGSNIVCGIASEGKHWMTKEFLWFIFWYPFEQLKVQRITTYVEISNTKSQRFTTHLGFELESRMQRAGKHGGDLLVFRMFRENCRFLGRRYAPKLLQQKAA